MSKLVIFTGLLLVLCGLASADVPVLLFGNSLPFKVPALKSLASAEFSNLLGSQITDETVTVVFVEPELKTEDLSCKQDGGVTCFENLNKIKEKSYLPRVSSPIDSVYDLEQAQLEAETADGVLNVAGKGKVIIVNLDPVTEKSDYVEHDKIIGSIYRQLAQKYKNIVIMYTGRQSETKTRHRRATGNVPAPKPHNVDWEIKKDNHFAIAAEKVIKKVGDAAPTESPVVSVSSTPVTFGEYAGLEVAITTTVGAFTLMFRRSGGNWDLIGAKDGTKRINRYPLHLFATEKYAMRCGEGLEFYDHESKTSYTIWNSQFLPVFDADANIMFDADKTVHCNVYFSPGILAGLFVVLLLLIIMVIGLGFIMEIRTMDKFDDPKGKTITISATD